MIELENYNSAKELLIEKKDTRSPSLVQHWNRGPESKRTRVAVHMEGMRVVMKM